MKSALNSDCDELNRRYGAPERIVFRPAASGCPEVVMAGTFGSVTISLFGAQVLNYRPTGQSPVFFCPSTYDFASLEEVHGGVPVCWPWFGAFGEIGQGKHGFARYACWEVRATEYSEDVSEITLGLESSPATKDLWPHDFDLEYKLTLSRKLTLALRTKNTGTESCSFTEGFHPYFRVRDISSISLKGLDGVERIDFEGSRIVEAGKREHVILDPGLRRALAMVSRGNSKCVVWNPGPIVDDTWQNLKPGDERNFLCLEPANIPREKAVTLAPGEEHTLVCAIQSTQDSSEKA